MTSKNTRNREEPRLPDLLQRLLIAGRSVPIPATYLFHGPRGIGKKQAALLWSRHLLCTRPGHPDMTACPSCAQFDKFSPENVHHPDILQISPGEGTSIPIDETRRLLSELSNAPLLGSRRTAILDEAHLLTESAANSLLKTLEDPPEKTLIILVTPYPDNLLPTLLSRTVSVGFSGRTREEMEESLETLPGHNRMSSAEKNMLFLFSRGAPGQLDALRNSPQWPLFDKLPRALTQPQTGTLFDMDLIPLLSDPSGFPFLLDTMESLLLDLYRMDAGDTRTSLPVPSGLRNAVSHLKREEFHDRVQRLRTLTIHNINRSLAVEELLWDWNETLASVNDETPQSD